MKVIVTGAAGFIGSCLVRMLNNRGITDVIAVDEIQSTDRWRLLSNKMYSEYIHKDRFLMLLQQYSGKITHVIHMGACSSTTERNFDYLYQNNVEYSKALWDFCVQEYIPFIYASSAATYGDGKNGFCDTDDINNLRPLNGYGYSKQLFDQWVEKQNKRPKQYVGLKFFNVYGPNEYYKEDMTSVVCKAYRQILQTGEMGLFRSYHSQYEDGGQLRDFIYVKDVCKVISYLMDHTEVNGIFNLGTGKARSFFDLVSATFKAMGVPTNIKFIDMPDHLKKKYQYYTQADMNKLRDAGYTSSFFSLEDGVKDYVQNYLACDEAMY